MVGCKYQLGYRFLTNHTLHIVSLDICIRGPKADSSSAPAASSSTLSRAAAMSKLNPNAGEWVPTYVALCCAISSLFCSV